ncbi:MAG: photosystem I reaction center subunit IX [Salinisphaeraceae bacterium]|nr:photosystem I reaction center subunit IX [Salinisphaeraceae bacterium]
MKNNLSSKILRAALLVFAVVGAVSAQEAKQENSDYSVLQDGIAHDRVFSIAMEDDFGVAVGELGEVLITEDGGASWTSEQAPTQLALLGVVAVDGVIVAIGQQGLILRRESNGAWETVSSGTKERLLQIDMNANGLGYIVGAFGTVLRTENAGRKWIAAAPDWEGLIDIEQGGGGMNQALLEPSLYTVQVTDSGAVVLGGEVGYIVYSVDEGHSWCVGHRGESNIETISPSVFDLKIGEDGVGMAVGQSGLLLRTADYGATWQDISAPDDANLFAVALMDGSKMAVTGMRVAFYSEDAGQSWRADKGNDMATSWYVDLVQAGNAQKVGKLLAVGHSGRIVQLPY